MRKVIAILITSIFLAGCCDIVCERQKHAELIIEKAERFKTEHGKLPEKLEEVGIDESQDHLSFYVKKNKDEFEVWYGLSLGESRIFNSKTKNGDMKEDDNKLYGKQQAKCLRRQPFAPSTTTSKERNCGLTARRAKA